MERKGTERKGRGENIVADEIQHHDQVCYSTLEYNVTSCTGLKSNSRITGGEENSGQLYQVTRYRNTAVSDRTVWVPEQTVFISRLSLLKTCLAFSAARFPKAVQF